MTIINPTLPSGYVIFCDDIRHEVTGKTTFVGAYSVVMFINGTLPTVLPRICLAIAYREEQDSLEDVTIKVFFPGDEDESPTASFDLKPQADMIPPPTDEFMMREYRLYLDLPGITLKQEGRIKVRAYRGDAEIRLGSLTVAINPELDMGATTETEGSAGT